MNMPYYLLLILGAWKLLELANIAALFTVRQINMRIFKIFPNEPREWWIPNIDFSNFYNAAGKYKIPGRGKIHVKEVLHNSEDIEELLK